MNSGELQIRRSGSNPVSTITVVDSLAETTRYQDRELLEQSLVITLSDLFPDQRFKLYHLARIDGDIKASLAVDAEGGTQLSPLNQGRSELSPPLCDALAEAIETSQPVTRVDEARNNVRVVYPIYDRHSDVSDVLVQVTEQAEAENQRLTEALLRVYANYLALLDDSHRDRLTNLLNRQTLDGEITKYIVGGTQNETTVRQRRRADSGRAWLTLIDIDHFKRINDSLGHLYGDEVLILLARLLEKIFRTEDLIFRYGGEEFVVIFRAPRLEDAENICQRARSTIANHPFPNVGHVTVSIGVTEIARQDGVAIVIDEADKALYFAKEHGRDQVRFFATLIEQGLIEQARPSIDSAVDFF